MASRLLALLSRFGWKVFNFIRLNPGSFVFAKSENELSPCALGTVFQDLRRYLKIRLCIE